MGSKLGEVSEEIRKALDDMPVHTQQLFVMFRKHHAKNAQSRSDFLNADRSALQMAESIGWRGDGPMPNDIVNMPKGSRPDPSTYLTAEYMEKWAKSFEGGPGRVMPASDWKEYGAFREDQTSFVMTRTDMMNMVEGGADLRDIEKGLGLAPGHYGDGPVLTIEFPNARGDDIKIPSGNEAGAHPGYWIPGGQTPNGNFEGVVSQTPEGGGLHYPSSSIR